MHGTEVKRAVAATRSIVASLGLPADDAIVLNNSNKLILRVLPGDVLARVAPAGEENAAFELELAQRLVETGSPMAALAPGVEPIPYERDGFVVTLWTYYAKAEPISPSAYAQALEQLHVGMRAVEIASPHYTDRVEDAQRLLADRNLTPDLADEDRELLVGTLRDLTRAIEERRPAEQLLHGEPHPGNLLSTPSGPRFIDLETCCRGPVEFDLAHAPDEVSEFYPGVDRALLRDCRLLMLAMITTWRWDKGDQFPNGRQLGKEWLDQIRGFASGAAEVG